MNTFLSQLRDEDVTATMYLGAPQDAPRPGKKNRVCALVREAAERLDPDLFFHTILTTHICCSPRELCECASYTLTRSASPTATNLPDNDLFLDEALERTRKVRDDAALGGLDAARKALKYMAVMLKDQMLLYRAALGTYDTSLAAMAAQITNMDPKQYGAFLEELRTLHPMYARFRIDVQLKRFAKALESISQVCVFAREEIHTALADRIICP